MSTVRRRDRRQYNKDRRSALRAAGMCTDCAKYPAPGERLCRICTLKSISRKNFGTSSYWPALLDLFVRQKGKCAYTGKPLRIGVNASIDHVVPRSKHPQNDLSNIVWVRVDVNFSKRAQSIFEYIQQCKDVLTGVGYEVKRYVDKITQKKSCLS